MPSTNMNETKMCIATGSTLFAILTAYLMASAFYDVVPARHQAIWTQFQRVKYNETSGPGFYWKLPWVKGIHMFTGPDKDDVSYTCGTKDGITFEGKVAITNRLLPENVLESYLIHGENPDRANIYDMAEFIMQTICAQMTAREFLITKINITDDLLCKAMVEAQNKSNSGLEILQSKVKVFKPKPTNSNIGDVIKMEAEHRSAAKTADEKRKLDAKLASLAADKQVSTEKLARARNIAEQLRITDSQETELARQKKKLNAEKERAEIRHAMDRAAAKKEADVKVIAAKADKEAGLELATKNKELLTDAYLRSLEIYALSNNTKIYYGDSIGDVFRLHKEPSI
jgi:hypothetical protein